MPCHTIAYIRSTSLTSRRLCSSRGLCDDDDSVPPAWCQKNERRRRWFSDRKKIGLTKFPLSRRDPWRRKCRAATHKLSVLRVCLVLSRGPCSSMHTPCCLPPLVVSFGWRTTGLGRQVLALVSFWDVRRLCVQWRACAAVDAFFLGDVFRARSAGKNGHGVASDLGDRAREGKRGERAGQAALWRTFAFYESGVGGALCKVVERPSAFAGRPRLVVSMK